MTTYQVQDDQGRVVSSHDTYEAAYRAATDWAGVDGIVGHNGDLSDGGDRTLLWASEEDAQDDPGVRAIGAIRIGD